MLFLTSFVSNDFNSQELIETRPKNVYSNLLTTSLISYLEYRIVITIEVSNNNK